MLSFGPWVGLGVDDRRAFGRGVNMMRRSHDQHGPAMGMSTGEWARYLSEDLSVGLSPDRVAAVVIDRMAACYAERLPLMPGADGALRRLGARWRLALASSSPRQLIDTVLALAGWDELFEVTT